MLNALLMVEEHCQLGTIFTVFFHKSLHPQTEGTQPCALPQGGHWRTGMLLCGSQPSLQAAATQAGSAALTAMPHGYDQSAQPMKARPSS